MPPKRPPTSARLPGPGTFEVPVVGESHYQDNLTAICGRRKKTGEEKFVTASLIPYNNPKDDQAVRVEIEGKIVGHLSRNNARRYRQQMESIGQPELTATCEAVIRGGWQRSETDIGHYGVWLDLPATESDEPLGPATVLQAKTKSTKRFYETWWGRVLIGLGLLFACGILSNLFPPAG